MARVKKPRSPKSKKGKRGKRGKKGSDETRLSTPEELEMGSPVGPELGDPPQTKTKATYGKSKTIKYKTVKKIKGKKGRGEIKDTRLTPADELGGPELGDTGDYVVVPPAKTTKQLQEEMFKFRGKTTKSRDVTGQRVSSPEELTAYDEHLGSLKDDLWKEIDAPMSKFEKITETEIPSINVKMESLGLSSADTAEFLRLKEQIWNGVDSALVSVKGKQAIAAAETLSRQELLTHTEKWLALDRDGKLAIDGSEGVELADLFDKVSHTDNPDLVLAEIIVRE